MAKQLLPIFNKLLTYKNLKLLRVFFVFMHYRIGHRYNLWLN